jgi:hypothetical protein
MSLTSLKDQDKPEKHGDLGKRFRLEELLRSSEYIKSQADS